MTARWKSILVWAIAALCFIIGVYILMVIAAPATGVGVLTGLDPHDTERKLQDPPGAHGDRLYIPRINVNVPIGTGEAALEKGAWHRKPENGDPEQGGNFVLSAHRFVMSFTPQGTAVKSPFYRIGELEDGDSLVVDYHDKRYEYKVTKKYSVKPNAVEIEERTSEARLTLYSCTLQGSADGRDVIEAVPVGSPTNVD